MENPPAFPHYAESEGSGSVNEPGMSLLDHFAGLAMQECMRDAKLTGDEESAELLAHGAYNFAKAMLKEREEILKDF